MSKKIKSFSLAEMLIGLLLTTIIVAAAMPLMTKQNSKGNDADSIACIKNDLAKNASLDISKTACNSNPDSPCCKSIVSCTYKMTNACSTLIYYADYSKTAEQNNARKVLREVCDQGGEKACEYIALSCKRDSSVCDIPNSDYDLHYYLTLPPNNSNSGRILIGNIVKRYYDLNYGPIVDILGNTCCTDGFNTACKINNTAACCAAHWGKGFGGTVQGDYAEDIIIDPSGYIYIVGGQFTLTDGNCDPFVIKLDRNGNAVWKKRYGGTAEDSIYKIRTDSSGGAYVTGFTRTGTTSGDMDVLVMKLDSYGNMVWEKKYGGTAAEQGWALELDISGNIYVTGSENSDTYSSTDMFLLKLDNYGNVIWQKKVGGTRGDYSYSLDLDSSGNIYITGDEDTVAFSAFTDIPIIKLSPDGNLIWKKRFGNAGGYDTAWEIAVDSSGNLYLTGNENSEFTGGSSNEEMFLIKVSTNGNIIWGKRLSGSGRDYGKGIAVDSSGNIHLVGYSPSETYGGIDVVALKFDSYGNILWKRKFGGGSNDYGYGVATDPTAKCSYFTGYELSTSGSIDGFIINLSENETNNLSLPVVNWANLQQADLDSTFNVSDLNNTKFTASNVTLFTESNLGTEFNPTAINTSKIFGLP